ncbi:sugar 3,4-ketoisomerase [Sulfitobacter sabulilitoris]|uniref:WxcM-like domain-containing protein n=1 Tax=Sulfitobacter sabulilitoris TaxID=2562655 RepID=A0A5S3PZ93_9RHOB|nr:FdtA/QdtA family cupin domain-containing protein [Sulfitobacter sabulilitoris]TMM49158.1 WxcM-like domain-containing protein [Sulfitobacter sabulilitoris]
MQDTTENAGVPRLLDAPAFVDGRGSLGVLEGAALPFDIARIYYLYDVPIGAVRGEHGHKRLHQLMICMHGQTEITLNDGNQQYPFTLSTPGQVLYVPPGMWRRLRFVMPETVVCVLASRPYEVDDYIYEYEDFLTWVRQGKKQQD